MKNLTLLILLSIITFQTAFAQSNSNHNKYIVQDSIVLNLPSGGNLCAIVIRKDTNVKMPCLVMYNIYSDTSYLKYEAAKGVVDRGYVTIEVDTRGKYCSTDQIEPFEHEAEDGYYIIDWISKQPWSNGKVGMLFGSYLGFTQWATTKRLHPALKTIIPTVAANPGIDFPRQNGVFMTWNGCMLSAIQS